MFNSAEDFCLIIDFIEVRYKWNVTVFGGFPNKSTPAIIFDVKVRLVVCSLLWLAVIPVWYLLWCTGSHPCVSETRFQAHMHKSLKKQLNYCRIKKGKLSTALHDLCLRNKTQRRSGEKGDFPASSNRSFIQFPRSLTLMGGSWISPAHQGTTELRYERNWYQVLLWPWRQPARWLSNMKFPHDNLSVLATCHYGASISWYINATNGTWWIQTEWLH